jgi:Pyruvate/2-oxoacid:ferredoxin oxidoreductase gamma subunit
MVALRQVDLLRPDGVALINHETEASETEPSESPFVPDLREALAKITARCHFLPATDIARELGSAQAANIVMLGAITTVTGLVSEEAMKDA